MWGVLAFPPPFSLLLLTCQPAGHKQSRITILYDSHSPQYITSYREEDSYVVPLSPPPALSLICSFTPQAALPPPLLISPSILQPGQPGLLAAPLPRPQLFSFPSFMCSVNFLMAKIPGVPQGPYSLRVKMPSLIPSLA